MCSCRKEIPLTATVPLFQTDSCHSSLKNIHVDTGPQQEAFNTSNPEGGASPAGQTLHMKPRSVPLSPPVPAAASAFLHRHLREATAAATRSGDGGAADHTAGHETRPEAHILVAEGQMTFDLC